MHSLTRNEDGVTDQKVYAEHPFGADYRAHKLTDARLDVGGKNQDVEDRLITGIDIQAVTTASQGEIQVYFQWSPCICMLQTFHILYFQIMLHQINPLKNSYYI